MRHLVRYAFLLTAILALALYAVFPPSEKIRLGKDLAGGTSLTYQVDIRPTDPSGTLAQVIELLKRRIDPTGLMEISIEALGNDRVVITIPQPSERLKELRGEFESLLAQLGRGNISAKQFDRVVSRPAAERGTELAQMAGGDAERKRLLEEAAAAYDQSQRTLEAFNKQWPQLEAALDSLNKQLEQAQTSAQPKEAIDALIKQRDEAQIALDTPAMEAAKAERDYEKKRDAAISTTISIPELRRVLSLPKQDRTYRDTAGNWQKLSNPRTRALADVKKRYPQAESRLDAVVAAYDKYAQNRKTMDDPEDLQRLLRGAGVLTFRITVNPGELGGESQLRAELREKGPRAIGSAPYRWCKVNKEDAWFDTREQQEAFFADGPGYFARRGYVVDEFEGQYWMLTHDSRGKRLTQSEGTWSLKAARPGVDQFNRQSINFEMDALGGERMSQLTEANKGHQMAVLLDDEVYTAPTIQSKIGNHGQITGTFGDEEIKYVVRVLSAGSLAARISQEPVSTSILGPSLGADNLEASFVTGVVAFALVAGFMIVYYFTSGAIAVAALIYNCLLAVGFLALNKTAFTLPGIAGIILTFGQAVDSNVLIYERMREELYHGHDLKTAVRLGFSRALSPIVDGNVSNLIICIVLGFFGTEEIKAFAITLGIGVATTLFSTLVFTRWVFAVMLEKFGWRKTSQLPMSVPMVQRFLSPHVDWMKHRWVHLGLLTAFLAASGIMAWSRGSDLLGMEFRGGTAVTLVFKQSTAPDGTVTQTKMKRAEVEKRVKTIAAEAPRGNSLHQLENALVVAVNPDADYVTSGTFTVRSLITDPKVVQEAMVHAFQDVLDVRPALRFTGSDAAAIKAPVFPMLDASVGAAIGTPTRDIGNAPEYQGGAAILLSDITPRITKEELDLRLKTARAKSEFSDIAARTWETRIIAGNAGEVTSAVVLIHDPDIGVGETERWEQELRDREWVWVNVGLTQAQALAAVQSFSPSIARAFAAQAVVCTALSLLLLTIYVFARFGTVRWAVAATIPLFADVLGMLGLLGLAQILYAHPATHGFSHAIGLRPFEVDLAQIAALLTIVGYSLNDKIIILDRIRENKGRMKYASAKVINDSINQTLSRTVITAGAHMITTIALYAFGGEAVRGFAFTFNLGVLLGTYTSIVSTPLVWSRNMDMSALQDAAPEAGAGTTAVPPLPRQANGQPAHQPKRLT